VPFENLSLLLAVFLSRSHKAAQECHFDYTIIIASRCLVNKKGGAGAKKARRTEERQGQSRSKSDTFDNSCSFWAFCAISLSKYDKM
jgi:hypothetical protein